MQCPHCRTTIHKQVTNIDIARDSAFWSVEVQLCPECNNSIIELVSKNISRAGGREYPSGERLRYFAYPKSTSRPKPHPEVPANFSRDYVEAALVIQDSPKASAALSRRCLQHLLREKAGVKKSDLAKEIEEVIASGHLPSHLVEAIDAVRNIGNFAAHPIKSSSTGEVVEVEPGEAEWNLDVLDGLFDFYFVQPSILLQKRKALNAKLADANKPPIK